MNGLPESAHRLFAEPKDVTVITLDPDGSPQASLVWAERDGDDILIGIQHPHRKTRNLRRDPRVTLLVQDDQVSSRGITQYLTIRGTAKLEGPDIPADYKALMDRLSQRYLNLPEFPFGQGIWHTGVIARITVEQVAGEGPWGKH
ncbi:PPOX class F420-dependent oxidoreductase [Kribbella pittospori]|uniref:PPOX class F420-dependent oxidoreductase n=1 Tax=Kribbella pittospori TaxID=722689 RepID=A0A4R0KU80_9ACTN|nr:PPOX class F420-dependent oxidoreductase [Kribbella pittospori]TCC59615.1 PPOX class F420-dependent oxidoreductase [Kribbella pittospori]